MNQILPAAAAAKDGTAIRRGIQARAESGDILGAIAFGQAANRSIRDPLVEQTLVSLRATAFPALRLAAVKATPAAALDPFPGLDGVPEIAAADLTAEILAGAILHHGSLLVRGLLDRADAIRLRHDMDRAFEARAAFVGGTPVEQTTPWYARVEDNNAPGVSRPFVENFDGIWTADSPRILYTLIEHFTRNGILGLVGDVLGEPPTLSIGKSTLRRVGRDVGTDWWHQDGAFLGAGIRTVNIWLALSECGQDAPGLDVLSRRVPDIVPTGTDGAHFGWSVGRAMVDRLCADGARIVSPVFAPGDALLFDQMMLHCTGVRPHMTQTRWAIETWMFAPSTFPMEQLPLVL